MDGSPIGKLPPELRNRIYTLALCGAKTITFSPQARSAKKKIILKPTQPEHRPPRGLALAATCRQIRQESLVLFYAHNDFAFVSDIAALKCFCRRIHRPNASALRSVAIKLFAQVKINVTERVTPATIARNSLRGFRKLAKHYGWTQATGEMRFMLEGILLLTELIYTTVNVGDLRETWDEFISEMERMSVTARTYETRHHYRRIKIEVLGWKQMLMEC